MEEGRGGETETETGYTASSTVVHEHTILQSHRVNRRYKE